MKKKEKENLKEMKMTELEKKLIDLRTTIRSMRFKAEGAKSKNVKESSNLKKDIARVLTLINLQKQHAK